MEISLVNSAAPTASVQSQQVGRVVKEHLMPWMKRAAYAIAYTLSILFLLVGALVVCFVWSPWPVVMLAVVLFAANVLHQPPSAEKKSYR